MTSGASINHYELLGKIGSGGMGEVYLAEDSKLGRRVALKMLPPELRGSPERRRRFEREARVLAALNHPNIVTLHSVEEADGTAFLAMELVEGRTLRELLDATGPLPPQELVDVALQVAEGLAEAHAHRLVHRDLKPQNVMLTRAGRVKLLDFGLATIQAPAAREPLASDAATCSAELTREEKLVGTLAYMSPEQLLGRELDGRSDQFSLGTMLYELATGSRPFQGATVAATVARILEARPAPLSELRPELPPELGRIVDRCLRKDPAERYRDTRELVADLKALARAGAAGGVAAASGARLLLVEDEPALARGLADNLRGEGYEVRVVGRGDLALPAVRDFRPDLLLLDVMLPGRSGLDILRELRAGDQRLPILLLTAKGEVVDRVVGLELGADDYLPKPFAVRELLARVRALLRRGGAGAAPSGAGRTRKETKMGAKRSLIAAVLTLLVATTAPAQERDVLGLMTRAKLDADLGNYQGAMEAFARIAADASARDALRWEALVRLGLARSAAGDARGSAEAFRQVVADYSGDPAAIRFLTYAVAGVVPGKTWPLLKAEFEDLLRTASVVSVEELGMGMRPRRVHLKKGEAELRAAFKPAPGPQPGSGDSHLAEVAAYELDKVLALDMVPPTVERSVQKQEGSLQLWVHGCKVYKELRDETPATDWDGQLSRMQLFDALIGNRDRNLSNILVDKSGQMVLIDHARAFSDDTTLGSLPAQFDRRLLGKLRGLNQEGLQLRLRGILGKAEVQNILERRDAILAHVEKLVGERGEQAVIF